MATWPPDLDAFKLDADLLGDDRSDDALQVTLDAAVEYVERIHAGTFQFVVDPESDLPLPDDDLVLGTLRLARRWDQRRQSPDALVVQGDVSNTIPSYDVDIERLLRIGRYLPMRFA